MTLTIELPAATERRLADTAKRLGKTLEQYAADVLESVADAGEGETFDKILAPFRKEVAESGMTEAELDAFFQEVREEVWQEKTK
jgi:membrane-bound lytic murein transglycosylase B